MTFSPAPLGGPEQPVWNRPRLNGRLPLKQAFSRPANADAPCWNVARPGHEPPFVVALVELEEGVRMLGNLVDVDPAAVSIGLPVEVVFDRIDDELTLPNWRPAR